MKRLKMLVLCALGCVTFFWVAEAQATDFYGRYTVSITINVTTPIPNGDIVFCEASIQSLDNGFLLNNDTATAIATLSSPTGTFGPVYTCSVVIGYYWQLITPATDTINGTYTVEIVPSNLSTSTTQNLVRTGTHPLPTLVVIPVDMTQTFVEVVTRL